MTSDEFVAAVVKLQTDNQLKDSEVASALAGILVLLCERNGEEPISFLRWAMQFHQRAALSG